MSEQTPRPTRRNMALRLMPFVIFSIFALVALIRILSSNPEQDNQLPDALAGRPIPQTLLPLLIPAADKTTHFDPQNFKGRVTLVNFWGSWCAPCREEHPQLLKLAADRRFDLVGVNFKDSKENAQRFLGSFGNPFQMIGFDATGRAALDWGVYGPPETFVINKQGIIAYKHIGPITPQSLHTNLLPEIEKALK